MKTVRAFLAHSKGDDAMKIADLRARVWKILEAASAGRNPVAVIPGRDDFEENFKRCGSWDAWARDVVERIDHATRDPVYSAIVVTDWRVGAATARIVEAALRHGTRIFALNGANLVPIKSIEVLSDGNFRMGWEVRP